MKAASYKVHWRAGWKARSDEPLRPASGVEVDQLDGLTLRVHTNRVASTLTAVFISLAVVLLVLVLFLIGALKVAREYERAIVFRSADCFPSKGPGLFFPDPGRDRW